MRETNTQISVANSVRDLSLRDFVCAPIPPEATSDSNFYLGVRSRNSARPIDGTRILLAYGNPGESRAARSARIHGSDHPDHDR